MVKINRKNIPFEERGDKIEIRLKDGDWNIYYKKEVGLTELPSLLKELNHFGIELAIKKKTNGKSWWD